MYKLRRTDGSFRMNRKAVSPVIAVLLMIAIAVAAAILVYVWSMGLIGTLQTGGGQQVKEQIIMDSYSWTTDNLIMIVRNVGQANVIIDAAYIGGLTASGLDVGGTPLDVQTTAILTLTPDLTLNPTDGVAYTVKLVTKTGGVFTFMCVKGSSG